MFTGSPKWIKVNERRTLHDVLKEPDFIIPGIPGKIQCTNFFIIGFVQNFLTVMYLQSSMLFRRDPAFTASSKLESGLLQMYEGRNKHDLKVECFKLQVLKFDCSSSNCFGLPFKLELPSNYCSCLVSERCQAGLVANDSTRIRGTSLE